MKNYDPTSRTITESSKDRSVEDFPESCSDYESRRKVLVDKCAALLEETKLAMVNKELERAYRLHNTRQTYLNYIHAWDAVIFQYTEYQVGITNGRELNDALIGLKVLQQNYTKTFAKFNDEDISRVMQSTDSQKSRHLAVCELLTSEYDQRDRVQNNEFLALLQEVESDPSQDEILEIPLANQLAAVPLNRSTCHLKREEPMKSYHRRLVNDSLR